MNSESTPSARATQFRELLVATANLGPYVRRRPPLKLVVALVVAFVVAGAAAGGTVAAASTIDPAISSAQAGAADAGHMLAGSADGTLVGEPIVRTASGSQTVEVGAAPGGATTLVVGFDCIDPGSFAWLIDGKRFSTYPDCEPGGGAGSTIAATGTSHHSFEVRTARSARFVVWLSWMKVPKLTASSAEKQELADGIVTRDEYVAAFSRYTGCLAALGHPTGKLPTGIAPDPGISSAAVKDGSYARCLNTEFEGVDQLWQEELNQSDLGDRSIDACLAHFGVVPDSSPASRMIQLHQLLGADASCPWIG